MITIRQAEVAAGNSVRGSVAPEAGVSVNAAWLVWRLKVVNTNILSEGSSAIEDYNVVDKCALKAGPAGAAFELAIPAVGPLSHDGKLFQIIWEVVVGTESGSSANKVAEYARFKVVAGAAPP
jgi:hypothetical protein